MTYNKTISAEKQSVRQAKELLNWGALSSLLTGGNDRIRKNRIPDKRKERVDLLINYISLWIEEKEMYSPQEIEDRISKIDLKTIILGE